MALGVGLLFLPTDFAAGFFPFYALGAVLTIAAIAGFVIGGPMGGAVAGLVAVSALWLASGMAVRRDWLAKGGKAATA